MSQQTLEDVKNELASWCSQNKKRKPIPQPLRLKALALLEHYRKGTVCKGLNINASMIDKWANPISPKSKLKKRPNTVEAVSPTMIRVIDLTGSSGEKLRSCLIYIYS